MKKSWQGYARRYLAKRERFPEDITPGRVWGIWREDLLPVKWERVRISKDQAYMIRRIYRRLAGLKGRESLQDLQVFIDHGNVVRLLSHLGYDLEGILAFTSTAMFEGHPIA